MVLSAFEVAWYLAREPSFSMWRSEVPMFANLLFRTILLFSMTAGSFELRLSSDTDLRDSGVTGVATGVCSIDTLGFMKPGSCSYAPKRLIYVLMLNRLVKVVEIPGEVILSLFDWMLFYLDNLLYLLGID